MGITIVQKSDLSEPRPNARKALVLAGGAISGGAFKLGGLLALDHFLRNFSATEFDIHVGVSAGAFLAAPLSAGVEPHELLRAVRSSSGRLTRFSPTDFYLPNWRGLFGGPAALARDGMRIGPRLPASLLAAVAKRRREIRRRAAAFLDEPGLQNAESLVQPVAEELSRGPFRRTGGYLPSGLFDNQRIEAYVRRNLERNELPNDFRKLKLLTGRSLYILCVNVNTAQGVVFGHDEDPSATVSEAVQASTAIPGFFRPARVGPTGRRQDYVDGAIRKTANISTAARHGAELIICYNPFRPFVNYRYRPGSTSERSLSDMGVLAVLNQAFRTLLHSRLHLGLEKLQLDENFKGDCILIEPTETDARFFAMNPMAFWKRADATTHGYQSVKNSLERHDESIRRILSAYGIHGDVDAMGGELEAIRSAEDATDRLDIMESSTPRGPRTGGLQLVSGAS